MHVCNNFGCWSDTLTQTQIPYFLHPWTEQEQENFITYWRGSQERFVTVGFTLFK